MLTAKVFQSGNSQAIRIPREIRTDLAEYSISKVGECLILYPKDDPWYPLRQTIGTFPSDFMEERDQPLCSDIPEREGL